MGDLVKHPDDDARLLKTVEWIEGKTDETIIHDDLVYTLHWFQTELDKSKRQAADRIEELEAFVKAHTSADEGAYADLKRKYEALVDGIQDLLKNSGPLMETPGSGAFVRVVPADELRALIDP